MAREYENDILYHYTDYQALDGILRQAQLRVNNVLNMNDAAEMRYFMEGLCDAVAGRLEGDGDHERAEWVRELFREELKKEFFYSAYAACFSLFRDDAAQWERYGNRGRGVCIAFQGKYLQRMAKGVLSLQTVFYQDDMAAHNLTGVFYRLVKRKKDLAEAEHGTVQASLVPVGAGSAPGGLPFRERIFRSEPLLSCDCGAHQEILSVGSDGHVSESRNRTGGAGAGDHHRAGVHSVQAYYAGLPAGQWIERAGGEGLPVPVSAAQIPVMTAE